MDAITEEAMLLEPENISRRSDPKPDEDGI
jgi:hypothetical protein